MAASSKRAAARASSDGHSRLELAWDRNLVAPDSALPGVTLPMAQGETLREGMALGPVAAEMPEPLTLKWATTLLPKRPAQALDRRLASRVPTAVLLRERKQALDLLEDDATEPAVKLLEQLREQMPKDPQVIGGLGLAWLRLGRHADAEPLFDQALQLDPDNANKWKSLLATARYWKLLKQAVAERDRQEYAAALVTVHQAIALEPKNVEGLAQLANILYASGDATQAEVTYRNGLEIEADNGTAIRGLTKLLVDQKRLGDALKLLDGLGRFSIDVGGRFTYLRVGILRDQADALVQRGNVVEAVGLLEDAVSMEPTNAWARYDLALLLLPTSPQRSRKVLDDGRVLAPRDSDMQYASALYFAKLDEPDLALNCLAQIPPGDITPSITRLTQRMTMQSLILQAAVLDKRGQVAEASAVLDRARATAGDDPDFLYSLANTWMARDQPMPALDLLRSALARAATPPTALMLRFALLLNRAQQDVELASLLRGLAKQTDLTPSDRSEMVALERLMNLRMAYAYLKDGMVSEARALAEQMERDAPQDSRIVMLQGNIARQDAQYDEAMLYYRRANALELQALQTSVGGLTAAQEEIDALERRRQAHFSIAYDRRSKAGAPGISEMVVDEVPVEIRLPMGYHGHAQVNVEQVRLRAGAFDLTDSYALTRYGKVQALSPSGLASSDPQQAQGTSLAVGYEADNWRFDVGSTPLGFPVQDVVGGIRWYGSGAGLAVSVDVSRRPVTSSLLSYAGTSDPVTGEIWGGVRSTGASVRIARDYDAFDASLSLGYHFLDGRNVLSNTQIEMRPQLTWTLLQDKEMRLTTGLSYTYWKFAEDLSYYTFGHGGYYSPQLYQSIALPLRWGGANGRWVYSLDGSLSTSWTQTKDMAYYPTDAALQAAAGNPVHAGSDSKGSGFSLSAAFEYLLSPALVLGGRWEIGRSAYYAPNAAMLYLRYFFDRRSEGVALSPDIPRSSQRF